LVEFLVLLGDFLQVDQTLVLGEDGQEVESNVAELGSLAEGFVQLLDFFAADTTVLGEESELFAVRVEFCQVHHILVDGEESLLLGGSREENGSVTAFDGVLHAGWLVIWGRVALLDVTNGEWGEKVSGHFIERGGASGTHGLLWCSTNWLCLSKWLGNWLFLSNGFVLSSFSRVLSSLLLLLAEESDRLGDELGGCDCLRGELLHDLSTRRETRQHIYKNDY